MQAILPGSYVLVVNPTPAYDGITAPTKIIAFDMVLSTATSVPEATVYKTVKTLYENKDALTQAFAPFKDYDPSNIAKPVVDVKYHQGAIKFFEEAGIKPKS
jgi:hypothetical protein